MLTAPCHCGARSGKPVLGGGKKKDFRAVTLNAKPTLHSEQWVETACALQKATVEGVTDQCVSQLGGAGLPTTNVEEWRFCDVTPFATLSPRAPIALQSKNRAHEGATADVGEQFKKVVLCDGVSDSSFTKTSNNSHSCFTPSRGNTFALLNGAACSQVHTINASDVEHVYIVHITSDKHLSGEDTWPLRSPRVHVHIPAGKAATVVEEFVGGAGGITNSVTEISIGEGGECEHMLLQAQDAPPGDVKSPDSTACAHFVRSTFVSQEEGSAYSLGELSLGSAIARHDLDIVSNGSQTHTDLKTFNLVGPNQLQDLHSRLAIDYPSCIGDQLHKSIACDGSSHSVFDGNINVSRSGQQADASQLTRNLLLAPRARVNARPNLQINADDVACTHGCTVSDLGEEELFYFRARGVGQELARVALMEAFGLHVVEKMPCGEQARAHATSLLREKLNSAIGASLRPA